MCRVDVFLEPLHRFLCTLHGNLCKVGPLFGYYFDQIVIFEMESISKIQRHVVELETEIRFWKFHFLQVFFLKIQVNFWPTKNHEENWIFKNGFQFLIPLYVSEFSILTPSQKFQLGQNSAQKGVRPYTGFRVGCTKSCGGVLETRLPYTTCEIALTDD